MNGGKYGNSIDGQRGSLSSSNQTYSLGGQRNYNENNSMNMFDDDLEKGFNISKDMTFVYAISKNFKHEVVGALFEWLYHSGIE